MDLFAPIVESQQIHNNFRPLADPVLGAPERSVLSSWADGFVDRDGKFVREFQTTFNSSFWELYLFACFKELGCSIDFQHSSPDFAVESAYGPFVAEATTAAHADGYAPEWARSYDPESLRNFRSEQLLLLSTIRLANAIYSKWQKYRQSYSSLEHVKAKPFVICVAPFEQPFFFLQNDNALRRVLYGFDQVLYRDNEQEGTRTIFGEARMERVVKDNGTKIELGFFTRPGMEEVSAVIFSNTATFTKVRALAKTGPYPILFFAVRYNANDLKRTEISKPRPEYQETLLDGLHVCINPFARHPLDIGLFQGREIALHTYDPEISRYVTEAPNGFLFQHSCMSFVSPDVTEKLNIQAVPRTSFRQQQLPQFPEGQLVQADGQVFTFTDNHLCHYRGWTILVARDQDDDDWGAQAIPGLFYTLAEYHRAPKGEDYLLPSAWHSTPQAALDAMKRAVKLRIDPKERRKELAKQLAKAKNRKRRRA